MPMPRIVWPRAGSRHQPADKATSFSKIALAIIIGRLVHFGLHDAFEIGHGAVEFALAGLDADDRMRRTAELMRARGRPRDVSSKPS